MPSSRNHPRGGHDEIKARRRVICEKSATFCGEISEKIITSQRLRRPKTAPEFLACRNVAAELLLNVTIRGSVGRVQVLMSSEATVADLVIASVQKYLKERRRPVLPSTDPADFNLHESEFTFESLNREVKLGALGRRNFFLCPQKPATEYETTSFLSPSCNCKKAETTAKSHSFSCLIMLVEFLFNSDGIL